MSDLSTQPAIPQRTVIASDMIPPPLGRYIRYWYTYRTAVAVLIALVLTGSMYWLYGQQLTCDAHETGCFANVSVHPEDRFANQYDRASRSTGCLSASTAPACGRSANTRCRAIAMRTPCSTWKKKGPRGPLPTPDYRHRRDPQKPVPE